MISPELAGGRYRIERPIGAGGMATVHLGEDLRLRRPVAIKVLADNLATDPAFRERFEREARLAARLAHRNVVQVFDVGEEGGRPYIVMEYVDGSTLAEELTRRGPLPWTEVRDVALQVCAGLQHAHKAGLVHRDVKPGNLLRAADGTVKIADFGIARAADAAHLTLTGSVLGTAAYLSPEQAAGLAVTPAADLYSLGVVLHELLTGARPPAGGATGLLDAVAPPVEPAAAEALARCLAERPEDRPRSAAALAADLATPTPAVAPASGVVPATGVVPAAVAGPPTTDEVTLVDAIPAGAAVDAIPAADGGTQVLSQPMPLPAAAAAAPRHRRRRATVVGAVLVAALLLGLVLRAVAHRGAPARRAAPDAVTTTRPAPSTTAASPPATARQQVVPTVRSRTGCAQGGQNLSGRVLVGSDFANADLACADFSGSSLTAADFHNADLRGANFSGANLTGVSFRNADLRGADLSGTSQLGVTWKGAQCPDGHDADDKRGCQADRGD